MGETGYVKDRVTGLGGMVLRHGNRVDWRCLRQGNRVVGGIIRYDNREVGELVMWKSDVICMVE